MCIGDRAPIAAILCVMLGVGYIEIARVVNAWRDLDKYCLRQFGTRDQFSIELGWNEFHVFTRAKGPPFPLTAPYIFGERRGFISRPYWHPGVYVEWHWETAPNV